MRFRSSAISSLVGLATWEWNQDSFNVSPMTYAPKARLVDRAREAARLPELSELVLPAPRAECLERVPYESSHLDDLIAALVSCHVDVQSRSGRWLTPADLRALLYLFLAPERVMDDPEWRGRLLRFSADRFTARAVRYAALRYRAMTNVDLS